MFVADDFGGQPGFSLAVIEAAWHSEERLRHQDVLGAVMGESIERGKVGDIILTPGMARIIVDEKLAPFLRDNLLTIGSERVETAIGDLQNIPPKEERTKDISATVASLRLDAIAAAGFGLSRTKAAEAIDMGKVKLNWQEAKSASQAVKAGDVLSMRGRGRVEVAAIGGQSKKGRTIVKLKRFI